MTMNCILQLGELLHTAALSSLSKCTFVDDDLLLAIRALVSWTVDWHPRLHMQHDDVATAYYNIVAMLYHILTLLCVIWA